MSKKLLSMFGMLIIVALALSNIAALNVVDTTSRPPKPDPYCQVFDTKTKEVGGLTCNLERDKVQPMQMKEYVVCFDYFWSSYLHRWIKYIKSAGWTRWEPIDPTVVAYDVAECTDPMTIDWVGLGEGTLACRFKYLNDYGVWESVMNAAGTQEWVRASEQHDVFIKNDGTTIQMAGICSLNLWEVGYYAPDLNRYRAIDDGTGLDTGMIRDGSWDNDMFFPNPFWPGW